MNTTKQFIEVIYSAVSDNNMSRALPVLDERVVIRMPEDVSYGGEYHGRSGFLTLMSNVYTLWESLRLTSLIYFIPEKGISENSIITTGKLEGRPHGSNAVIIVPFIHYWIVENGKIVELRAFHWGANARPNQPRSDIDGFDLLGDNAKSWPKWGVLM